MRKISYPPFVLIFFYLSFLISSHLYGSDENINEQGFFISGSISGYCFNDQNQNGQLDESEQKAAGVRASLQRLFSSIEVGSMETDEDGYYEFTKLGVGFYLLEAQPAARIKTQPITPSSQ